TRLVRLADWNRDLMNIERDVFVTMRNSGRISEEVMREIEYGLDLEEALLDQRLDVATGHLDQLRSTRDEPPDEPPEPTAPAPTSEFGPIGDRCRCALAPLWNDRPGHLRRAVRGSRPVKARLARLVNTRARRITAVVVVVLLIAGIVWVAWPTRPPTPVATRNVTITAAGGPGVDQPVQLDATLYVPRRTPAPAIIMAHGFGGSKDSVAADAQQFARDGFTVLAYSARGFGASTGQIGLDSLDYEIPDARSIVDWLAEQPEVQLDAPGDPRVGVTGGSYGGALSLMLAGTDRRI